MASRLGVAIVHQYEQGVVFRLGRLRPKLRQAGTRFMIPFVDEQFLDHERVDGGRSRSPG